MRLLVKMKPGVDFTNILPEAFTSADHKKYWQFDCIFSLLGSLCVKAACKMLVKMKPDDDVSHRVQLVEVGIEPESTGSGWPARLSVMVGLNRFRLLKPPMKCKVRCKQWHLHPEAFPVIENQMWTIQNFEKNFLKPAMVKTDKWGHLLGANYQFEWFRLF